MKTCVVCENTILNITSNCQKTCSDVCRKKLSKIHNKKFQEKRRIAKGQSLYANCSICSKEFYKTEGRGKHKLSVCSEECKKVRSSLRAKKELSRRKKLGKVCIVEGCSNVAVRTKMTLCENHFYQKRRTGSFEKKKYEKTADQGHYIRVLNSYFPDHPMRSKKVKMLYEHRMVAYDSRNGVCEDCFWCGKKLTWKTCVIDHLNEDKHDNRPENLLISCPSCNRGRGSMLNLISKMKKDSYPIFLKAIEDYREKHGTFQK